MYTQRRLECVRSTICCLLLVSLFLCRRSLGSVNQFFSLTNMISRFCANSKWRTPKTFLFYFCQETNAIRGTSYRMYKWDSNSSKHQTNFEEKRRKSLSFLAHTLYRLRLRIIKNEDIRLARTMGRTFNSFFSSESV